MISSTCSIRWRLSPRPDPTFSFAAERSEGQGWPKAIAKRLALDGREHSGRLVETRRSSIVASATGFSRATPLSLCALRFSVFSNADLSSFEGCFVVHVRQCIADCQEETIQFRG